MENMIRTSIVGACLALCNGCGIASAQTPQTSASHSAGAMAFAEIPNRGIAVFRDIKNDFPNGGSAAEVEAAAIARCREIAREAKFPSADCRIVLRYDGECAAAAASIPEYPNQPIHHAWATAGTRDKAKREAEALCLRKARAVGQRYCNAFASSCDK